MAGDNLRFRQGDGEGYGDESILGRPKLISWRRSRTFVMPVEHTGAAFRLMVPLRRGWGELRSMLLVEESRRDGSRPVLGVNRRRAPGPIA